MELRKTVAENITNLRKKSGMTQLEMAEKLNYTDKAISKWERGESVPDIEVLKNIADLFGVDVNYLICDGTENKQIKEKKGSTRTHVTVSALSVLLVWFLATVGFVAVSLATNGSNAKWLCFLYALPVSFIVLIVFNSIWFNKRRNYYLISALMWTTLISVCLSFTVLSGNNIKLWLLMVLGIPGQIIIFTWSRIKARPFKIFKKFFNKEGDNNV